MKELVSMLEKVFEAQNGDARISSEICALSCQACWEKCFKLKTEMLEFLREYVLCAAKHVVKRVHVGKRV